MSSQQPDTRERILKATWKLMEEHQGKGVKMSDIARVAGISRQALYLHFDSRTELMAATVQYVDEVKGLNERLQVFKTATTGVELLDACIEVWGNYIPEIYGLARALSSTRDTDEAAAAAWNGCMGCLRDVCQQTIETLDQEQQLAPSWSVDEAVAMLWSLLSVNQWEQLVIECGWSMQQYVSRMKSLLRRVFVMQAIVPD